MKQVIHCIGGAAIDNKLQALQSFLPHTSNPVRGFTTFGGVARNVAENLARWQATVKLQTVVGNDVHGEQLLAHMHNLGVATEGTLTIKDQRTAQYFAAIDPSGALAIAFADMQIFDHIPTSFTNPWCQWQQHEIVFLETNLPPSILNLAIQYAAEKAIKLCIDPVSVAKSKRLPINLENVFVIKPNTLELAALTNRCVQTQKDILQASYHLLDRGIRHVVTTLGEEGFMWVSETGYRHGAAPTCADIKDVNGCGDAFVAGLLYGLAEDATLLDACEFGQKAAMNVLKTHHSVVDSQAASP